MHHATPLGYREVAQHMIIGLPEQRQGRHQLGLYILCRCWIYLSESIGCGTWIWGSGIPRGWALLICGLSASRFCRLVVMCTCILRFLLFWADGIVAVMEMLVRFKPLYTRDDILSTSNFLPPPFPPPPPLSCKSQSSQHIASNLLKKHCHVGPP